MRRLRKFLHLSSSDRTLLIEALIVILVLKLGLWLLPFRVLHTYSLKLSQVLMQPHGLEGHRIQSIVQSIEIVTWHIPGKAKCLARAMAVQFMLRRRNHQTSLHIGVTKRTDSVLEAHAWLEYDGVIVIGGVPDFNRFKPLVIL
ncbi:MAG: lasso peptide biosynthesis B2 protein [Kaiparowitsia implicata GSE-PSE-MK54-09C]|jgi:hypothetical protein|nr:lasso peptide biosynthesis B2 protein [Kaiparowitsia implicata GSE-PSE-MK54-09C]